MCKKLVGMLEAAAVVTRECQLRKAVTGSGVRVALQDGRFGEAMASSSVPCPK